MSKPLREIATVPDDQQATHATVPYGATSATDESVHCDYSGIPATTLVWGVTSYRMRPNEMSETNDTQQAAPPREPTPKFARRHRCFTCGEDQGPWNSMCDRYDTCGKPECARYAGEAAAAEREEAHEQLDRDMDF